MTVFKRENFSECYVEMPCLMDIKFTSPPTHNKIYVEQTSCVLLWHCHLLRRFSSKSKIKIDASL